jgi:pilus assembly protein CpaF
MTIQIHRRSVDSITDRVATSRRSAQHRHRALPKKEFQFHPPGRLETSLDDARVLQNLPELPASETAADAVEPADILFLETPDRQVVPPIAVAPTRNPSNMMSAVVDAARQQIRPILFDYIDTNEAATLTREELELHLGPVLVSIMAEKRISLSGGERRELLDSLIDDMLGYGPLQPLINDPSISEILVNQPNQVFVERKGKLELSAVKFQDEAHVRNIAVRIANRVGRRVDETTPMCDARLDDGSRVNIILPPLSLKGTSISIRKFTVKKFGLDELATTKSMSKDMAQFLGVAVRSRLSILISGGTGSGKTTLLNAMSGQIGPEERIITIEDAAELQLQQPHVVTLETRMSNVQGEGAIPIRDLLRNALRMRPDRIIVGEVRGNEAVDMLQAMNTGHDGSFGTIHANSPRDALMRLENMAEMAQLGMSSHSIRAQIASALDLVVHVERLPDGERRVTSITEIVGMSEGVLATQELFSFDIADHWEGGSLRGAFKRTGLMPHFMPQAERSGFGRLMKQALTMAIEPGAEARAH